MKEYLELLDNVIENGIDQIDRTNVGTKSVFGRQIRFNLKDGFPLMTTKELHIKSIVHELLWFINGDTNIKYLLENNVNIWNEWPYEKFIKSNEYKGETIKEFTTKILNDNNFAITWGELGPVYGEQWRNWKSDNQVGIDQLKNVIESLRNTPSSRRHIVSAWNPSTIDKMALPPCHCLFQFYIANNKLSCQLYQRSADIFLGVPFNIASYALLTHMIASVLNCEVGEFVHTFGDLHIYSNHLEQAKLQLSRNTFDLPKLLIKRKVNDIEDFKFEDFEFENYKFHPKIKAKVAI